MSRWQQAYDALTGERYPGLLAHARLLCDSDDDAEALVREAVVAAVSRARRFPPDDLLAVEVRDAISRRAAVLGSAPREESTASSDHHPDWDERESALEALAPGAVHHPGDRHHDSVQGVRRAGPPAAGLAAAGRAPHDAASAEPAAPSTAPMRGSPFAPPPGFVARSVTRAPAHAHAPTADRPLTAGDDLTAESAQTDPYAPPPDGGDRHHRTSEPGSSRGAVAPGDGAATTASAHDPNLGPLDERAHKAGAPEVGHEPPPSEPDPEPDPEAQQDPVADAFADLDTSTRALVVLYHLDGVSPRRVADLTGMTSPEARRRIDAGADSIGRAAGIIVAPAVVDDALAEVEVTIDAGP
ncbi:hypothetical protein [Demequina sp. NBRC 110056]|uniref:hypothetical protein n=1 Tax=Demequina sp. NBRC 110056 TaxID=1570345 RepID=UPI0009FE8D3A|nr:hypothetical protein [Demequina sp. NBRC 110056]